MKERHYFEIFKEALEERNLTIKDLEENNVLKKDTFYNFSTYCPSLINAIKIANFLKLSLDYILGNVDTNVFKPYKEVQNNFHSIYRKILKAYNVSNYRISKEIDIAENNVTKWKNGAIPKFSTVIAISDYLGCGVDDLLEHE